MPTTTQVNQRRQQLLNLGNPNPTGSTVDLLQTRRNQIKTISRAQKPIIDKKPIINKPETPKTIVDNIKSAVELIGPKIGKVLQQIPEINLGTKGKELLEKTNTKGIIENTFSNFSTNNPLLNEVKNQITATKTEEKILNFISNMPSNFVRDWGKNIEQLSTEKGRERAKNDLKNLPKTINEVKTHIENKEWQKAYETAMSNTAFTLALDATDFVPVGFLAKFGLKPLKQLTKERTLAKTLFDEVLEETEEQAVKKLKTVSGEELGFKEVMGEKVVKNVPEAPKPKPKSPQPLVGEAKEISVPREQLPVSSPEGKVKVSKLEARITASLKDISEETRQALGETKITGMTNKDQIRKASEYVVNNTEEAMAVIRGEKPAPKGLLDNAIFVALHNLAKDDTGLARRIASLKSSRFGQEIEILKEIDSNSPVKLMSDLVKIREESFKKRYKGKTVKEMSDKVVKDIKKKVKAPDKYDWNKFVESIQC